MRVVCDQCVGCMEIEGRDNVEVHNYMLLVSWVGVWQDLVCQQGKSSEQDVWEQVKSFYIKNISDNVTVIKNDVGVY